MNRPALRWWGVAAAVAVLVHVAAAQQRAAAPTATGGDSVIRIRELTGLGARARVSTPRYTVNVSGSGRGEAKEWVQLAVEYDTAPEWIDQLTFQYYVLLAKGGRGGPMEYALLRGGETYMDVAAGKKHLSTMYVRPTAVPRYGEVAAVAVEVLYQGNVIAKQDIKAIEQLPDQWWTNPKLAVKEGYLLRRQDTPFWFANYDDFEETVR